MSDPADDAQTLQAFALDSEARAAAAQAARLAAPVDARLCIDCDAEIPAERKVAVPGARRCAACQAAHERLTHVPVRLPC